MYPTTSSLSARKHSQVVPPETAHREAVEFDLSGKPQSDQDAERIAGLLGKTSCLTTLKLSRCSLTSTGFATICAALQENTTLEVLDLSANDCEDASRAIAAMLRANRTLKTLDLDNCWLNEENIAEIGEALDGNQALTDLNLLYNIPQNVHALAAILKRNTALTSLTIGCQSSLDCKGFPELWAALAQNSTLQRLVLSDMRLNGEHASCLTEALGKNSTLQDLAMHAVGLGRSSSGCFHRVSHDLRRNLGVRSFTLSRGFLTAQDCSTLAEMLERPSNRLERIHLRHLKRRRFISGTERLLNAIVTNRRLIELEHTDSELLTGPELVMVKRVTSDNAERRRLSTRAGFAMGSLIRDAGHMLPVELDWHLGEAFCEISNSGTVRNVVMAWPLRA